ncbi:hypothetical protein OE88DRAFT_1081602 [Heliocybe sulcata]|uniref:Uncharacterized protein n=1 Tax=Heliocybe sulcata TaxID=5364 RepID=A0A5C3MLN9_9AGAM|nr:hypothetical protein OE88DRAFT_1081602 [Heliocybe sulcata]
MITSIEQWSGEKEAASLATGIKFIRERYLEAGIGSAQTNASSARNTANPRILPSSVDPMRSQPRTRSDSPGSVQAGADVKIRGNRVRRPRSVTPPMPHGVRLLKHQLWQFSEVSPKFPGGLYESALVSSRCRQVGSYGTSQRTLPVFSSSQISATSSTQARRFPGMQDRDGSICFP